MDEPGGRIAELREQAIGVRVRAIEANNLLIGELSGIWRELNEFAVGHPEVRKMCDRIAGDIALLEKLNLAFDTEWLSEVRGTRP